MKFWQRAFLSTLLLFIFCFYISIFLVSNFSYRTGLKSERERSFGEAHFIASSLERDISALMLRGSDISAGGYSFFLAYTGYYQDRGVYLELWKNDKLLIGNIPDLSLVKPSANLGEQVSSIIEHDKNKFMLVEGVLSCGVDEFRLVYARDLQGFIHDHSVLTRFLIISGAAITIVLAAGLFFLLRRLSKPIEKLDEATGYISGGDYSVRVPVKGTDELAALAKSFNSMADEIEAKVHELQTNAEQKQRFIDNLAHELRNPLTTIRGYAEYMRNANINEDDRIASIDHIVSEAVRIDEMTNKLLDLALLRNNTLESEPIDIQELFASVSDSLRLRLSEKNIRLDISSGLSSVNGDRVLIESMLVNLLDNAIKASAEGSAVELSGSVENGNCAIQIHDFGKGMPDEHIAKLTEPFYRIDKARSRSEGGAGLGLALCEQIARHHNAKLMFSSEAGKGTTVKIIFTTP